MSLEPKKLAPVLGLGLCCTAAGYAICMLVSPSKSAEPAIHLSAEGALAPVAEQLVIKQDKRALVLTAARQLPVGTVLRAEDFTWREWPEEFVQSDYVKQTDAAEAPTLYAGTMVRNEMLAGEPFNKQRIVRWGDKSSLALNITAGMRAFTIPVSAQDGVAGFVLPGDRVDLMLKRRIEASDKNSSGFDPSKSLTFLRYMSQKRPDLFAKMSAQPAPLEENAEMPEGVRPNPYGPISNALNKQIWSFAPDADGRSVAFVETILSNVKILAIDQNTTRSSGKQDAEGRDSKVPSTAAQLGATATIEILPEQAELLALALDQGKLSLSLRGITDNQLASEQSDNMPKVAGFFGRFMPGQIKGDDIMPSAQSNKMTILRGDVMSKLSINGSTANKTNIAVHEQGGASNDPERTMLRMLRALSPIEPKQPATASKVAASASPQAAPQITVPTVAPNSAEPSTSAPFNNAVRP